MNVFIFRTDGPQNGYLVKELAAGRLRQGWGVPGSALVRDGAVVPYEIWRDKYRAGGEAVG